MTWIVEPEKIAREWMWDRSSHRSKRMQRNRGKGAPAKPQAMVYREVGGILFVAFSSFLFLALLSYHPQDPSWNSSGTTPFAALEDVHNKAGVLGSYCADFLFQIFGMSALMIPLGFLLLGLRLFFGTTLRVGWLRPVGVFAMTIVGGTLLHIYSPQVTLFSRTIPAGGTIGHILSHTFIRFLNRPGAYLVCSGLFLALFVGVTGLSLSRALKLFLRSFAFLETWIPALSGVGARLIAWRPHFLFKAKENRRIQKVGVEPTAEGPVEFNPDLSDPDLQEAGFEQVSAAQIEGEIDREMDGEDEGPRIVTRLPQTANRKAPRLQESFTFTALDHEYQLPAADLLHMELEKPTPIDEWSLRMNSKILEKKLLDYGVEGRVVEIHPGPVITMYEFEPAPGVKVGKVVNLTDDLSLSMGGRSVRIVAPIPGKPVIGIEIPNHERETVTLCEIVQHESFRQDQGLTLALGKDIEGEAVITNLAKMPHLLVAGATGTGKSVSINAMICSLLMKATPDRVRFLMIDPKMVELPVYAGIPHLLLPVITDPKKASLALKWAVEEMEQRLKLLAQAGTRNIDNFNKIVSGRKNLPSPPTEEGLEAPQEEIRAILNRHGQLPYVVILIDELADLMMVAGREIEESLTRLAQMARAVGIHLIVATQRPSVDVITGLIKANFPARISFKVSSRIDSRTILDVMGSEALLGDGDMLFMRPGTAQIQRIHGSYVTENEVSKIVDFLKKQGTPQYEESILEAKDEEGIPLDPEESDELYDEAVKIVTSSGQASVSYVQRRLRIGYNRAARIVEMMEKNGLIGPADGVKPREIYASRLE